MGHTCKGWWANWTPCGPGWRVLHEAVERLAVAQGARVVTVKEKWGGLRIYVAGGDEALNQAVEEAEAWSCKMCECCGTETDVTTEGQWLKTLCLPCREAR